jgi:hypothetical protein
MGSDDEAKLMLAACNAAAEVFVDAFQEEEDTEPPNETIGENQAAEIQPCPCPTMH